MSIPSETILDYRSRTHTIMGKAFRGSVSKVHFKRLHERCRRSFYKFICKRGDFYPLESTAQPLWFLSTLAEVRVEGVRTYYFRQCHPWTRGYPSFEAGRSHVRDLWDSLFDLQEPFRKAEKERQRLEREASDNRITISIAKHSPLIQVTKLAHALQRRSQNN